MDKRNFPAALSHELEDSESWPDERRYIAYEDKTRDADISTNKIL